MYIEENGYRFINLKFIVVFQLYYIILNCLKFILKIFGKVIFFDIQILVLVNFELYLYCN